MRDARVARPAAGAAVDRPRRRDA